MTSDEDVPPSEVEGEEVVKVKSLVHSTSGEVGQQKHRSDSLECVDTRCCQSDGEGLEALFQVQRKPTQSLCRLHHNVSFGSGEKDILAVYEVHPDTLDELSLFKDEPLYKVHRQTEEEVWKETEGDGQDRRVERASSEGLIRSYCVGTATSLWSHSSDEQQLSDVNNQYLRLVRRKRSRHLMESGSRGEVYFMKSAKTYGFNDNLIWTICEFLPQEEVVTRLVYVAKAWRRALRKFPLILDQGAVKSFLGKRAIRLASHSLILHQMLTQWSIGFLCIRLKTRDTLESLIAEFPSLQYSTWGLVIKAKKKNRWITPREVNALVSLRSLQVLDIRCCEGLITLTDILSTSVHTLRRIDLSGCTTLIDVNILSQCSTLESLCLDNVENLEEFPDLCAHNLQSFLLGNCEKLTRLPNLVSQCINIRRLHLGNCSSLHSIGNFGDWASLREISIARCDLFVDCILFSSFVNLVTLDLAYCKSLKRVTGLRFCSMLQHVTFEYCTKLRDVSGLRYCSNLRSIGLTYCKQLRDIASLVGCKGVGCFHLHTIQPNDLSIFVDGNEPLEMWSPTHGWTKRKEYNTIKPWGPTSTNLLLTTPGVFETIPSLYARLQDHDNDVFSPLSCIDSLETVEIRRCRKLKGIEALVCCHQLKRLSVHGCDLFPEVETDDPETVDQVLRRQIDIGWPRYVLGS